MKQFFLHWLKYLFCCFFLQYVYFLIETKLFKLKQLKDKCWSTPLIYVTEIFYHSKNANFLTLWFYFVLLLSDVTITVPSEGNQAFLIITEKYF